MRIALLVAALTGCAAGTPTPSNTPAPEQPAFRSAPIANAAPSASAALAAPTSAQAKPAPRPCGALDCLAFATPEAAFEYVLQSAPRVLAIGEAHAQEGTAGIHSSTRRFAEQLLPLLAGKIQTHRH